jgi:hypothetical protein
MLCDEVLFLRLPGAALRALPGHGATHGPAGYMSGAMKPRFRDTLRKRPARRS